VCDGGIKINLLFKFKKKCKKLFFKKPGERWFVVGVLLNHKGTRGAKEHKERRPHMKVVLWRTLRGISL
jgi:hypothetical protein